MIFDYLIALALDLVKKLLIVDPKVRFTTEEALRHPWLQVGVGTVPPGINYRQLSAVPEGDGGRSWKHVRFVRDCLMHLL